MTTNTNTNTDRNAKLAALQELLKEFSAADLKQALKAATENKPTAVSLTFDATIAAELNPSNGNMTTDAIHKVVCAKCAEHGIDQPQQSTVAALMRYGKARDDAWTRAGFEFTRKTPAPEPDGETASEAPQGATDAGSDASLTPEPGPLTDALLGAQEPSSSKRK